jgi:hypothetical protein
MSKNSPNRRQPKCRLGLGLRGGDSKGIFIWASSEAGYLTSTYEQSEFSIPGPNSRSDRSRVPLGVVITTNARFRAFAASSSDANSTGWPIECEPLTRNHFMLLSFVFLHSNADDSERLFDSLDMDGPSFVDSKCHREECRQWEHESRVHQYD